MDTLKYIVEKYGIDLDQGMPILLPIERRRAFSELLNELGLKVGAEIGVSKGHYSKWLFSRIRGLKLYCVDPWTVYDEYVELHDKEKQYVFDEIFEEAKKRLAGKNVEFIKKYSMDAVKDFEDGSLDFVYIDGNHSFQYVINDIAEWSKKVRVGGIVAGHDYWTSAERTPTLSYEPTQDEILRLCQVKDAVDAWTKSNQIQPWFVVTKDKCPSWFWVKQ